MKALVFITGRGIGGDAVVGLNVIRSLESRGFTCEIALDSNAPGLLYKRKGYSWHKVSIPQAGGHAANKVSTIKAAFKTIHAGLKSSRLIRKVKPDIVVSVIGGGAVIGSIGAKLTRTKCVSLINTPLDTTVCSKLNTCVILPENKIFKNEISKPNIYKAYYPITENIISGNYERGIEKVHESLNELKEKYPDKTFPDFDENKKTILFSSGSTLFEGTVIALEKFADKYSEDYNILLIGDPLKKEYYNHIDDSKVINLGYINWITDCYSICDLAVLTDDGNMIQEAIVCNLPPVALTRVKYGRYHNMAGIFKGVVVESEIKDATENIIKTLNNLDELKKNIPLYKDDILNTNNKIMDIISKELEK